MPRKLNYVVHAVTFDPNSGGTIFMHELVHQLNEMGEKASLLPLVLRAPGLRGWIRWIQDNRNYQWSDYLNTPRARRSDIGPDTVVVYPEMVLGNPLRARHVARWLLYTPGLGFPYRFGPDELFFRVDKMFDLPEVTGGAIDLHIYRLHPAYRNQNRPDRKGACYLVRKGGAKPRIPETADAIQIDGLSHEEIAEIFNRCEIFYSYDEASFYSQFAAICGCLSVVIPGRYATRQEWVQNYQIARYGIAYGLDDLDHARQTQHLVIELIREKEAESRATVRRFIEATRERFG